MLKSLNELLVSQKLFFLGLAISSSLLWPLFAAPYFSHHDNVQAIRLFEMNKCFADFQIPCRWVPDLGGLYGYPLFNYYAPLPYYFGEIFYLLSGSLIFSVKVMFIFPFIVGYIFMFLLGKKLWGVYGGVVSGVFYSFAPYHAVDFYVRGAMGELWALMVFPTIFWATYKLFEKTTITNSLYLTFFLATLFLSHNLSTMLFLPVSIAFMVLLYLFKRNIKFIQYFCLSILLSFLISSSYILPMIFEKNLVHVETTTFGYFSYTEHFKGIRKLFLERNFGWGSSIRQIPGGEKEGMSYQIGWAHLLLFLISITTLFLFRKKEKIKAAIGIFSMVVVLLSVFMIHPRSLIIWEILEPLKFLQFPWRFLILIIFFVSLVCGGIFLFLQTNFQRWVLLISSLILVVLLNFSYFRPEKFIQLSDQDLLMGKNWDSQIKRSIFDYLPKSAKAPPAELATGRYQVIVGDIQIKDFREGSNWIYFDAAVKDFSIIRLSQYYFPGWEVKVDDRPVEINPKNELGLITFAVDPGDHRVSAKLNDTPIRFLANWTSILGLILFLILILSRFEKTSRWLLYYVKRIS